MDVELLRPGTARPSQNTVLWFEFLLDPSLLENHLQKETPGNITLLDYDAFGTLVLCCFI
jgi:hypothetical protein